MYKKVLKPISSKPALADFYVSAHEKIFGKSVYVPPKYYPLMTVMEDDLRSQGIASREYAYTVVSALKRWALNKQMVCVPIRVFCSDFALNKALKVLQSKTVRINDEIHDNDMLLQAELSVARVYIIRNTENGDVVRLGDIVGELEHMLYPPWVELYNNRKKRPTAEALEILADEFRIIKSVRNYADIVDALRNG